MINSVRFSATDEIALLGQICNFKRCGIDEYDVNEALEDLAVADADLSKLDNSNNIFVLLLPNLYATAIIKYDDDGDVVSIGTVFGW